MAQEEFHGAFVFRNQGHGILSSTYFNTPTPKPYPETAIRNPDSDEKNPFIGTFETVWIEHGRHVHGHVTIAHHPIHAPAFELNWIEDAPSSLVWEGIGNIEGQIMIGCYWESQQH